MTDAQVGMTETQDTAPPAFFLDPDLQKTYIRCHFDRREKS